MKFIGQKKLEEKSMKQLEQGYAEAKEILDSPDKMTEFLNRLEEKLKVIPKIGDKLSHIPVFVSLIRDYIKKEYLVPMGTIIAVLSALIYFLSPVDLIIDSLPIIGLIDDAAVVAACLKLVNSDIEEYIEWRDNRRDSVTLN